jgi:hypothetical protein
MDLGKSYQLQPHVGLSIISATSTVYLILVDLSKLDSLNSIFLTSEDDASCNSVEIIVNSCSLISRHMHCSSSQPTLTLKTSPAQRQSVAGPK